jgi:hypothetical protein
MAATMRAARRPDVAKLSRLLDRDPSSRLAG